MAELAHQDTVPIVVFYQREHHMFNCDKRITMAEVRDAWHAEIGASPSVAFFTADQRYLSDEQTVSQALASANSLSLELHAVPRTIFWLQVFGYEDSLASFEVATILTPSAVRREIERTVGILTDDFRLSWDDAVLDQEQSFDNQNLIEGAQLTLDIHLTVIVHLERPEGVERRSVMCFGSQAIGDLHQQLGLGCDEVLVATSPYRRVLSNSLRLCHIVSDIMDLHVPIELTAEQKIIMSFEPITLPHLRQQLPIAMSSTPLDFYEMLSERFGMSTDFRLTVNGEELDNCKPLIEQHLDSDTVIQLDILRPCKVRDQWIDLWEIWHDDEVYIYSTDSPRGLFLRDFANDQRLTYDRVDLTIYGTMLDVFGPITGQHRPVLLVDRDMERNLPLLSFDVVVQKLAWARSMLLDVIPMSRGLHPKEIMCYGSLAAVESSVNQLPLTGDSLITLDPLKVFVSSDKKLQMCRFARGSTHGDVRRRMQQAKRRLDVGLKVHGRPIMDVEMNHKLDLELYFLTSASRFQTKVTVSLDGKSFGCWFEPQQVSISDILISVGKQAKVPPRHLFPRKLFCRGCGRQLSMEEEPHQAVPADCCRVRSLLLSDRRVREVGTQTSGTRRRDVETLSKSYPESRDACVDKKPKYNSATVNASTEFENAYVDKKPKYNSATVNASLEYESVSVAHHPPNSLRIVATTPEGEVKRRTVSVSGYNCRAILSAATRQLSVRVGDATTMFCEEISYKRQGEWRRAVACFDEGKGSNYFDIKDGSLVRLDFLLCLHLRFLAPSSRLPSSPPNRQPLIYIETNTELLTVNRQRHLEVAPPNALWSSTFVLLLRGFRRGTQLFWKIGKAFVNSESGDIFSQQHIPDGAPRYHVVLLLRDDDRVPRINVPYMSVLVLHKRAGIELQVKNGYLRYAGLPQPAANMQLWDYVEYDTDLREDFSAAARKK